MDNRCGVCSVCHVEMPFSASYYKKIDAHKEAMDFTCIDRSGRSNTKRNVFIRSPLISRAASTNDRKEIGEIQPYISNQITNVMYTEPYCHVKLDSVMELKESTKKLLCLLENIHNKTRSMNQSFRDWTPTESIYETEINKTMSAEIVNSVTDVCATALKRLETQSHMLQNILTDEDDDCSIFKRLTRKCNCLNQQEYNDIIILFNQDTKYETTTTGEIIKNLRILKKFLYMGGGYSKHALMFLNEGFEFCSFNEKMEITQGCVHADMCNVFEDISIVVACIAWPDKYETYGDSVTQELAAAFLNRLAQFEEGQRYLNFTSKIAGDIKKVLKRKRSRLNFKTIDYLQDTLVKLNPTVTENKMIVASLSDINEGYGYKTVNELARYRKYMTMNDIYTQLDLLYQFSSEKNGRKELTICIRPLLELFQELLLAYDDSEMNIIITKILNNVVSKTLLLQDNVKPLPKIVTTSQAATEPIRMRSQCMQMPPIKKFKPNYKSSYRSRSYLKNLGFSGAKPHPKNDIILIPKEKPKCL